MRTNSIIKPIFLIGMGRSGSSIIYDVFSQHSDLAFFSQYCTKLIHFPQLTFAHRFFKTYRQKGQWQKQKTLEKIVPSPKEAYDNWEYLCGKKFRSSFLRDIKANPQEKEKTIRYINTLLKWQGKSRFVTKLTGPPRITFINSIFDNAVFIDIVRDPRATVNSLLNVGFRKKKGLAKMAWEGSLVGDDLKIWESYGKSPVAILALEWRAVYKQTKEEVKNLGPSNYKRVRYEDFVEAPRTILGEIYGFSNLSYTKHVDDFISKTYLKNTNFKYKETLTKTEINIIEEICKNEIEELRY